MRTLFLLFFIIGSSWLYSQKVPRTKIVAPVCDNVLFSYNAKASVVASQNTVFTWLREQVPGIANPRMDGSGPLINEYLINTTTNPIVVSYAITMMLASECVHTDTLKVIVNPTPHLSSPLWASICDSSLFNYTPLSAVANTSFAWSRPSVWGIANDSAKGVNNISERLIDTAYTFVKVPYYFKSTANSCVGIDTLTVQVIPRPFGTIVTDPKDSIYSGKLLKLKFKTTDTIPYKYVWDFGDGLTANTVLNPVQHYYNTRRDSLTPIKLDITNRYGCYNSFTSSIQVVGDSTPRPVDTFAVQRYYSIAVFPVPFTTDLKLKYSLLGPSETAQYVVNDMSGRLVYAQSITLPTGNNIINLPSDKMVKGVVYVVKINSKTYSYEDKVYRK